MTKRINTLVVFLLVFGFTNAQAPNRFSYQAVVRNASNTVLVSQPVGIRISILQGSISGSAVYVETHMANTTANGIVNLEIGGGTVVTGSMGGVNWSTGIYFIKTEMDLSGGVNYQVTATSQLLSAPYALFAAKAGSISGNTNFNHYVGELYGGGIVFHVYKDTLGVEHGLIASLQDISAGSVWSNLNALCAPTNGQPPQISPVNGFSNTQLIVNQAGHVTSAALLCRQYNGGGYNDWYLPATWELRLLYDAALTIEKVLGPTGKFKYEDYWTSTEEYISVAWSVSFSVGFSQGNKPKNSLFRVRAVRAF